MNGLRVVVTGASSGIGAAIAELLSSRGATVILVARREEELRTVAARCGREAHMIVADMTKRADVQRVVREVLSRFARIDVWINNVGQGITRPPSQLTDEDIDEMIRVNVKTALYGMQEVLPHFRERNAGQIINISSMLGRIPFATYRSAYNGAKHFLNALTMNFRMEVQESHPGIQVSLVSPGVVATEFGVHARYGGPDSRNLSNSQTASDVAEVVAGVINGRRVVVYTQAGARGRVISYYSSIGEDA